MAASFGARRASFGRADLGQASGTSAVACPGTGGTHSPAVLSTPVPRCIDSRWRRIASTLLPQRNWASATVSRMTGSRLIFSALPPSQRPPGTGGACGIGGQVELGEVVERTRIVGRVGEHHFEREAGLVVGTDQGLFVAFRANPVLATVSEISTCS